MTTKNTGKIEPELLSGLLDQELDPQNKKKIQTYLEQNPDAREQYKKLQIFSQQMRELNSIPVQPPEMKPFWKELKSRINLEESGLSQPEPAVSSTELLKIITESRKQPTMAQKIVGSFVPAFTGAIVALAVVYFFALSTGILDKNQTIVNQTPDSKLNQAKNSKDSSKNILVKTKQPDNKNLKKVSNPLLDKKFNKKTLPQPDQNIEKIINKDDSCVIERMDTEDDVITTVFKVKDKDGSMITVIWIPFKNASPSI
ncbi:MAG: anti-sigma factor family protein [Myxococcota bacterium]